MDRALCGMRWSRCLAYLDDVISFGTTAPWFIWRPLNIINISRSYLVDPNPISVTIDACDQDCILAKRTGIFERWINKLRMGWWIVPGQWTEYPEIFLTSRLDPGQSIRGRTQGKTGQVRPDGSDRTCPRCQTRVSVTPKITGRIGLMKSGMNRTHTNQPAHSRLDANVGLGIGWTRDQRWTERCEGRGPGGVPHVSVPYSVQMDQIACRLVET